MTKSTGLSFDDLRSMYPSEIKSLWEVVREVNSAFFEAAEAMGLGYMIREVKNQLLWGLTLSNPIFGELSADLSAGDTTNQPSGDTGGPTFLMAVEDAAAEDLTRVQETALAVRYGYAADKNEWQRFMKQGRKPSRKMASAADIEALAARMGTTVIKQGESSHDHGRQK